MQKPQLTKQPNRQVLEQALKETMQELEKNQTEINSQVGGYSAHFTNVATNLLIAIAQHPATDLLSTEADLPARAIALAETHRLKLQEYAAKLQEEAIIDPRLLEYREQLLQNMKHIGSELGYPQEKVETAQESLMNVVNGNGSVAELVKLSVAEPLDTLHPDANELSVESLSESEEEEKH